MANSVDGDIRLSVGMDTSGVKQGVNDTKKDVYGLSTVFKALGKVIAAAFSIKAIVNFGKEAISLASDLQEVQNVVDVSFGDMAYKIEAFAETAIENFGMSKLAAKQTAGTYMSMAKSMGINEEAASNMSVYLTGLTGDVASFYNISQELAATKLKGVFTGETEALKDLGVVMTEANLEQFALSQGITKTTKNMTQAEKVALRYAYVTETLKDASGDFVRTQDSWANQTRVLSEKWKEFMSVIGTILIDKLTPIVSFLNTLLSYLIGFAGKIASLFGVTTEQSDDTTASIGKSAEAQETLTEAVEDTAEANERALFGFDEINKLSSSSSESAASSSNDDSIIALLPDTVSIGDSVNNELKKIDFSILSDAFANIKKIAKTIWDSDAVQSFVGASKSRLNVFALFVKTMWGNIKTNASTTWKNIEDDLKLSGQNLVALWTSVWMDFDIATQTWGPPIVQSISDLFNSIWLTVIDPFVQLVTGVWSDFTGILLDLWNEYGGDLLLNIGEFVDNVLELFQKIYDDILEPIITPFLETMQKLWDEHISGMIKKAGEFIMKLVNGALEIYNKFIHPLIVWLLDTLKPIFAWIGNYISGIFYTIISTVSDVLGGIFDALGGLVDFIVGVFTGDWEKAWNGIKDFFCGIWDMIWGAIKGVINLIIDGLNSLWGGLYAALATIINGVGGLAKDIGEFFGQDWGWEIPDNPPLIPKLAQGAVIPPNREFLAVLGDQRHGTNIEAPLDTIKQAVAEVLGGGTGGGDWIIQIVDERGNVTGETIITAAERMNKRCGTTVIPIGG